MNLLFLGIILAVVGVLAIRLTANAKTIVQTISASLSQMLASVVGAYAIIDIIEVHEKLWWYALGVGIGTFLVIVTEERIKK